jgi:hypothetical protein
MNFLNRIFRRNMIDCPRCLGKGKVDLEDIKRLQKELFWIPGKCAYCNGIGRVPPDRIEKINVDFEYLTTDLPSWERSKVINGDEAALERGNEFKKLIQSFVQDIEHLYYIENKEPSEIANYIIHKHGKHEVSTLEKQELVNYIERVIKSKNKK